jgi:CxxC motif-containing protein (DUF1111 family)
MHDAKSNKIDDAIRRHDGEAKNARDGFVGMTQSDYDALSAFLGSL